MTLELVGKIIHPPNASSPELENMPFYEFKYAFMFLYDLFTMLFITFNASIYSTTFHVLISLRIVFKWWPWHPLVWDYICIRCICFKSPCCSLKCTIISGFIQQQFNKYRLAIEYRYQFITLLTVSIISVSTFWIDKEISQQYRNSGDILTFDDITMGVAILTCFELTVVIVLECFVDGLNLRLSDDNDAQGMLSHRRTGVQSDLDDENTKSAQQGENFALQSMINYKIYFVGISALISVRCVEFIFKSIGQNSADKV